MAMQSSHQKNCASDGTEEGINVAIRMRPLSGCITDSNTRVWRVSQKSKSITQTTAAGEPLEHVEGRSFFTFDKTFDEDSSTGQIYDSVARGILRSVMGGLNGTIFAYGQTNSGKTYTMQGGGSIEEGSCNKEGIVQMAAHDIFSHISKDPQRVFLIRVSFIEIYNEEVRDLLVDSNNENVLTIREDPRRGVFVNATETFVTGYQSLLGTLFKAEKNRSFARTKMNERSSRSHTIFRINIESRKKGNAGVEDSESNGAVRVSTLNLVDLAGSESVKHTNASGKRQKEGGKINQSLLTLSRVISALGSSNTFINFRDSKLTRILQPALSGNARMAIICCVNPSRLYLNETRTTLQFASRAKLVKTQAKINEVLDDRSLIKKLQRELASAKLANSESHTLSQFKALEIEAANANRKAERAEKDLQRLKSYLLRGGLLYGLLLPQNGDQVNAERPITPYSSDETYCNITGSSKPQMRKHRRMSDGAINRTSLMNNTNISNLPFTSPKSDSFKMETLGKTKVTCSKSITLSRNLISIANEALSLRAKIVEQEHAIKEQDDLISYAVERIDSKEKGNNGAELVALISNKEKLKKQKQEMVDTHAILLAKRNIKNQDAIYAIENILAEKENGVDINIPKDEILVASADTVYRKGEEEKKELKMRVQILLEQNELLKQKNASLLKRNNELQLLSEKKETIFEDQLQVETVTITQLNSDLKVADDFPKDSSVMNSNTELAGKISKPKEETQKITLLHRKDKFGDKEFCEKEQKSSALELDFSHKETCHKENASLSYTNSSQTCDASQLQALNTKVKNLSHEKESLSAKVNELQQDLDIIKSKYNIVLTNLVEQEKSSIADVQRIEEKYQKQINTLSNEISWITIEKENLSDRLVEIWESL